MEAIASNTYSFLQFISPKVQQLELQLTNVVPSGEYIFDSTAITPPPPGGVELERASICIVDFHSY